MHWVLSIDRNFNLKKIFLFFVLIFLLFLWKTWQKKKKKKERKKKKKRENEKNEKIKEQQKMKVHKRGKKEKRQLTMTCSVGLTREDECKRKEGTRKKKKKKRKRKEKLANQSVPRLFSRNLVLFWSRWPIRGEVVQNHNQPHTNKKKWRENCFFFFLFFLLSRKEVDESSEISLPRGPSQISETGLRVS